MRRDVGDLKASDIRRQEQENRELLAKLMPPDESLFYGKTDCLPGTRTSILDAIHQWVAGNIDISRIFWLYGVAGCGKSSVAASVCQNLHQGARAPGSFFCKRDQENRRDPVRLIWSLALYLANENAHLKDGILRALREADIFVNKTLKAQFERLIERPLSECADATVVSPVIFVIDALDECDACGEVAQLLAAVIDRAPWLLLIVTSRDLPEIRKEFASFDSSKREHDLYLDDASEDIRTFVRYEISSQGRLADLQPFLLELVEIFVEKSQGLFIWIWTAIAYIVRTEVGKLEAVEALLESPKATEAEAGLDDIYRTVLANAAGRTQTGRDVVQLIIGIIRVTSRFTPLPKTAIYAFLPPGLIVVPEEFEVVFNKLLPVLVITDGKVRAYHTSFLDFASSPRRCGDQFWLDTCSVDEGEIR